MVLINRLELPPAGAGSVAIRLSYLKDPRDIAVVKVAAERAGW
jgi:hypothetical protein